MSDRVLTRIYCALYYFKGGLSTGQAEIVVPQIQSPQLPEIAVFVVWLY